MRPPMECYTLGGRAVCMTLNGSVGLGRRSERPVPTKVGGRFWVAVVDT